MRYNQYQQTQIPWVEEIPCHWQQIRNGGLFDYHQDVVGEKYREYELLSLSTQGIKHKDISDVSGKVPKSYDSYQAVQPGDMVFCLFDLDCSAVFSGLSMYRGMITSAYDVMTPKTDIVNPRYLDYWFKSVFAGRYYKLFAKSIRYTINYDIFKALKTPVPPYDEQNQIVRFLDWQTSRINKLIHGFQREILLIRERTDSAISSAVLRGLNKDVKLKPTGLQNIEFIPEHWRILQNKRIFEERSEYSTTGNETLLSVSKHYGVKPYAELTDSEQYATIKPAESLVGYKKVKRYDVAMNIMRARNGSYGVSEYDGIVSSAYAVFKPIIECNPRYMHYLLKTPHVIGIFESYSYGIAEHRRRLYAVDFLRLHLPVPPVEEQNEIAHYVEGLQEQAQSAIQKIQKEINLLREYRTRLISDVVTGQMDVRGIEIPEYTMEEDAEDITEIDDIVDGEADTDDE